MRLRRQPALILLVVWVLGLAALVAIPALAASPTPASSPKAEPAASGAPGKSSEASGKSKRAKDKVPEVAVDLTGLVGTRTDASGETEYTLTVGSTTYTIDAGPSWYWKDDNPLKAYVGKNVKVTGEQRQGSTDVDVTTVDGKALREPGKPPWAGGWKAVGKDHPGWTQDKTDRWAAKVERKKARFGADCWPPGHCKDASGKPRTPNPTATPAP